MALISVDDQPPTLLGWPPYAAEYPVAPGRHHLEVQVVSTPRNIFGPFHHPLKPRMSAWSSIWAEFPEHQPAGAQYDVIDYGLMNPPSVGVSARKNRNRLRVPSSVALSDRETAMQEN